MEGQSESLDQLGTALAKAQSEIEGAAKSAKNPHLRNKYADFLSVVEATRPALTANGLSVSQPLTSLGNGLAVRTILLHASGQYISSIMPIEVQEQKGINRMQAVGSAVSYARRYAYESIVGVARIEDDDGRKSGPPKGGYDPPNQAPVAELTGADKVELDEHKKLTDNNRKDIWPRFTKWMGLMQQEKERLGGRVYYMTLKRNGWNKSNDAKSALGKDPAATLSKMQSVLTALKSIDEPYEDNWYQINLASLFGDYQTHQEAFESIAGKNAVNVTDVEKRKSIIAELEKQCPVNRAS